MSDTESEVGDPQYSLIYDDALETPEPFVSHDGTGVATFINGDKYLGGYIRGLRQGKGTYTFAKGGSYDGEYLAGLRHGQGTFQAPNGGTYVGGWIEGKKSGYGEYIYPNGDTFRGEWKLGKKNGKGTYSSTVNQTRFEGIWSNDKLVQANVQIGEKSQTRLFARFNPEGKPDGEAVYFHPNNRVTAGKFVKGAWIPHRYLDVTKSTAIQTQNAAEENAEKPASQEYTQAERIVSRVSLCADADDSVERLKKDVPGAPNFRRNAEWPIYACAQPTIPGLSSIINKVSEDGYNKIVFLLIRSEPVIYVESNSYGPRHPRATRHPLHFDLSPSELEKLETTWKIAVQTTLLDEQGGLSILRSTYADFRDDCSVLPLRLELAVDASVQTTTEAIGAACEENGTEFEIERVPYSTTTVDAEANFLSTIASLSKRVSEEESTAIVTIDAYGRLPTTVTSASLAVFRAVNAAITARNEAKEEEAAEIQEAAEPADEEEENETADKEEQESEDAAEGSSDNEAGTEEGETTADPGSADAESNVDATQTAQTTADPPPSEEAKPAESEVADVPASTPEHETTREEEIEEIAQQEPVTRCTTLISRILNAANVHPTSFSTVEAVLTTSSTMVHLRDSLENARAKYNSASSTELQYFWSRYATHLVQQCLFIAALTAYAESEADREAKAAAKQIAETNKNEEESEEGTSTSNPPEIFSFQAWLSKTENKSIRNWIVLGTERFKWV